MKKWIAVLVCICILCSSAPSSAYAVGLESSVEIWVDAACRVIVEKEIANAALPIVDKVNKQVIVFIQRDDILPLLKNDGFSSWDTIEKIMISFYNAFREATDKGNTSYAVYIVFTDDALLETAKEREIYWIYGTSKIAVHATLWRIRTGVDLPDSLNFLHTIKTK